LTLRRAAAIFQAVNQLSGLLHGELIGPATEGPDCTSAATLRESAERLARERAAALPWSPPA
jgi:hypothetical protein